MPSSTWPTYPPPTTTPTLHPHELQSFFLRLPAETRLHIYSYLIPRDGRIEVDLCTTVRPQSGIWELGTPRRSVCSGMLEQVGVIRGIVNGNGLQLLLVSRRTCAEVYPILARTTTRFHCHQCFDKFLPQISHGLGIGLEWMRHIEILLDLRCHMNHATQLTPEIARASARETMQNARRKARAFWGRLDLMGKERWGYAPLVGEGQTGMVEDLPGPPPAAVAPVAPVATVLGIPGWPGLALQNGLQGGNGNPLFPPSGAFPPPQAGAGAGAALVHTGPFAPAGTFPLPAMMHGMNLHGNGTRQAPLKWVISGWFDL